MSDSPILIIGQGIAGSMLAFELISMGAEVMIIDDGRTTAASMVEIASVNPITGRRYARTWGIDELLPRAAEAYGEIMDVLGQPYYSEAEMWQVLADDRIEEIWMLRAGDPGYADFLGAEIHEISIPGVRRCKAGRILQGHHLAINDFLNDAARWFADTGRLTIAPFDPRGLSIRGSQIEYLGRIWEHVVFCEGFRTIENPWFNWLELYPMKGEFLVLRIPECQLHAHLKTNISLIPLPGQQRYWCGSTYDRYDAQLSPTEEGRRYLEEQAAAILEVPFTVETQGVGIRATTRDRRPYLGSHPDHHRLHVITGMGTKGVSLAPWCAGIMADHLLAGGDIPFEVDILRNAPR